MFDRAECAYEPCLACEAFVSVEALTALSALLDQAFKTAAPSSNAPLSGAFGLSHNSVRPDDPNPALPRLFRDLPFEPCAFGPDLLKPGRDDNNRPNSGLADQVAHHWRGRGHDGQVDRVGHGPDGGWTLIPSTLRRFGFTGKTVTAGESKTLARERVRELFTISINIISENSTKTARKMAEISHAVPQCYADSA